MICARRSPASSPIRASRKSPSPPRGLRIIRQAGEGKRGDHLLLRQSVFENAAVPRQDLATVLDQLQAIRAITGAYGRARAA